MNIIQRDGKDLMSFLQRFNRETLSFPDLNQEDMTLAALKNGVTNLEPRSYILSLNFNTIGEVLKKFEGCMTAEAARDMYSNRKETLVKRARFIRRVGRRELI